MQPQVPSFNDNIHGHINEVRRPDLAHKCSCAPVMIWSWANTRSPTTGSIAGHTSGKRGTAVYVASKVSCSCSHSSSKHLQTDMQLAFALPSMAQSNVDVICIPHAPPKKHSCQRASSAADTSPRIGSTLLQPTGKARNQQNPLSVLSQKHSPKHNRMRHNLTTAGRQARIHCR